MTRDVALVTGGTGGLGRAICLALARDGHDVVFTYRSNAVAARELIDQVGDAGGRADAVACDLGAADGLDAVFARLADDDRRLKAVVYASGPSVDQPYVSELTRAELERVLREDVVGCFDLLRRSIPLLRDARGGAMVAVSSVAVHRYIPRDSLGAIPKSAVEALVRGIAREEGRHGIRANSVAPGIIDAGLGKQFMEDLYPDVADAQRRAIPLQRFGNADDVAGAVAYLASEAAAYVTGQTLVVDGGMQV